MSISDRIRLRESSGHGGHNGLRNIIDRLRSQNFKRIRIGVGNDARICRSTSTFSGKIGTDEEITLAPAVESVIGAKSTCLSQVSLSTKS